HFGDAAAVGVRVDLRGVRVEQRNFVDAVTVGNRVVVVFDEDQVTGRAGVGGNHAGGHDGGRVIPAKAARRLLQTQIAAEMQKEAARAVSRVSKNAEIDIAVGANRG